MWNLCRFATADGAARPGLTDGASVRDLRTAGVGTLTELLERADLVACMPDLLQRAGAPQPVQAVRLLAPVEQQEVWAAGVTYLRSKAARMAESSHSATAYDRVYEAARPEIFFKALPHKVSGPDGPVGIRRDARWNVPEPELALVFSSRGALVGCTIGNDMSSRDIEGDNLLYLPQAKIYRHSCALGPSIALLDEGAMRTKLIRLRIERGGAVVFAGETELQRIRRSFAELGDYLFRSQEFPHGAVLLTGTGIVPPDAFTLAPGDAVEIAVDGIGALRNTVVAV